MAICSECGKEFNVSSARKMINRNFGKGVYDDYYPSGDICGECAYETVSADYNAGAQVMEWLDDD